MHRVKRLNKNMDEEGGGRKFKFYTFSERISEAGENLISATRGISKLDEFTELKEGESLFGKRLQWIKEQENSTLDFSKFYRSVVAESQSAALVVHHSKTIVDNLILHLRVPNSLTLASLFDLTVVLAIDLQEDFVNLYFPKVFETLLSLLDPTNPENNSLVFHCITMLFKCCSKWLVLDLSVIRAQYSSVLGHKKEYIRRFASESFAFLLRKLKAKDALTHIKSLTKALEKVRDSRNEEYLVDGISALLYETMRSASGRLHSRFSVLFETILSSFDPYDYVSSRLKGNDNILNENSNEVFRVSFDMTRKMLERLLEYTRAEYADELWESLNISVTNTIQNWQKSAMEEKVNEMQLHFLSMYAARLLNLVVLCSSHRHGSRVSSNGFKVVIKLLELVSQSEIYNSTFWIDSAREESINLLKCSWIASSRNDVLNGDSYNSYFIKNASRFCQLNPSSSFASTFEKLALSFTKVLSPSIWCCAWLDPLMVYVKTASENSVDQSIILLLHITTLLNLKEISSLGDIDDVLSVSPRGKLRCGNISLSLKKQLGFVANKKSTGKKSKSMEVEDEESNSLISNLLSLSLFKGEKVPLTLWGIIHILQHLEIQQENVFNLFKYISNLINTSTSFSKNERNMLESEISLVQLSQLESMDEQSIHTMVTKCLNDIKVRPTDYISLHTCATILTLLVNSKKIVLNINDFSVTADYLAPALSSSSHLLRLNALRILVLFSELDYLKSSTNVYSGPCYIIKDLLGLEEKVPSLQTEREYAMLLERISNNLRSNQLPTIYVLPICRSLIGLIYVKFSYLWNIVSKTLSVAGENHFETIWPVVYESLCFSCTLYNSDDSSVEESENNSNEKHWEFHFQSVQDFFDNSHMLNLQKRSTDPETYHSILWKCLSSFAYKVEAKNSDLVKLFLVFLRDDYYGNSHKTDPEGGELDLSGVKGLPEPLARKLTLSPKSTGNRLRSFLHFFSAIKNTKGLFCNELLYSLWSRLLSKPDTVIQKAALDCLLNFKSQALVKYAEQLRGLTIDENFRDAMIAFPLQKESGCILDEHRSTIVPLVARILFGKMFRRFGKGSKDSNKARRAAILLYFSAIESNEIWELVKLAIRPFSCQSFDLIAPKSKKEVDELLSKIKVDNVPIQRRMGFLELMELFCSKLGKRAEDLLHITLAVISSCLQNAGAILILKQGNSENKEVDDEEMRHTNDRSDSEDLEGEEEDEEDIILDLSITPSKGEAKCIYNACILRIADILQTYDNFNYQVWTSALFEPLDFSARNLPIASQGATKPHALLRLVETASKHYQTSKIIPYCKPLMSNVLAVLSCGIQSHVPAGPTVVSSVLTILSQLLSTEESIVFLKPYFREILNHFTARLKIGGFAEREQNILSAIANHAIQDSQTIDSETSTALFSLLLPYLAKTGRSAPSDNSRISILNTLNALSISITFPEKHVGFISSLLGPGLTNIAVPAARKCLVQLIGRLGKHPDLNWFSDTASLVVELNAMSLRRIDEFDLEARMDGYERLRNGALFEFSKLHRYNMFPIVNQVLNDIIEEDRSLRSSAVAVLEQLIDVGSVKKDDEIVYDLSRNCLISLVIPGIKKAIRICRSDAQRRSLMLILRYIVVANPSCVPLHGDLSILANEEQDIDFFHAIIHLQFHRRSKALTRLQGCMKQLSLSSIVNFILPTIMHMIFESERVIQQQLRTDAITTLGFIAENLSWSHYTSVLRTLLSQIPRKVEMEKWLLKAVCVILDAFHFDLNEQVKEDVVEEEYDENEIEASNENKDNKNNNIDNNKDMNIIKSGNKPLDMLLNKLLPELRKYLVKKGEEGKSNHLRVSVALAIVKVIMKLPLKYSDSLIPGILAEVSGVLTSKLQDVRDETKSTLIKIMTDLGPKYLNTFLHQIRVILANGYQKQVLGHVVFEVLQALAPAMTPIMLSEEEVRLVEAWNGALSAISTMKDVKDDTREYSSIYKAADVCKNAIPKHVLENPPLEVAIPTLINIFLEDIIGDVGLTKKGEWKPKVSMRELKSCRSYDGWELVASCVRFLPLPMIHKITEPLFQKLSESEDKKTIQLVKELLRRTVVGLSKNPSVQPRHLMVYIQSILSGSVEAIGQSSNQVEKKQKTIDTWHSGASGATMIEKRVTRIEIEKEGSFIPAEIKMTGADRWAPRRRVGANNAIALADYSLMLFRSILKRKVLSPSDENHRSLIDPLISLIFNALNVMKNNDTRCLAFSVLISIVPWNLSVMDQLASKFSTISFQLLAGSGGSATDELGQACLKVINAILTRYPSVIIKEQQLKALLSVIADDVESSARQHATFGLIKSIISRVLVYPEVYDLMTRLNSILFTSQIESIRSSCCAVLLQFLLNYPLGAKRIQQHLATILNNLNYPHESGRLAGLDILHAIILKFPEPMLESISDQIFFPLVLRLVNDDSSTVKASVGTVLKLLLGKVEPARFKTFSSYMTTWIGDGGSPVLCIAGIQVIGLACESRPSGFDKSLIETMMTSIENILSSSSLEEFSSKDTSDSLKEDDKERAALIAAGVPIEWILPATKSGENEGSDDKNEELWQSSYFCLTTVSKMLSAFPEIMKSLLETRKKLLPVIASMIDHYHVWVRLASSRLLGWYFSSLSVTSIGSWLSSPGCLYHCVKSHANALEINNLSERLGEQVVKNLLFLCSVMHKYPTLSYTGLEEEDEEINEEEEDEEEQEKEKNERKKDPISWITHKLSYSARKGVLIKRNFILKFFAALSMSMKSKEITPYLIPILMPTVRIADGLIVKTFSETAKDEESLKEISNQLLELLEKHVGHDAFIIAFNKVRDHISRIKIDRKRKIAVEKIVDPKAAAIRKKRKTDSKIASKKRKINDFKSERGVEKKMKKE